MSRGVTFATAVAVLLAFAPGVAGAAAPQGDCARATVVADRATLRKAANAIACLVNAERAQRAIQPLRRSRPLGRAARAHSRDMVAHGYFSHASRNGDAASDRAARAGYKGSSGAAAVQETIGWGMAQFATPSALVRSFMDSEPHRRTLLDASFDEIGVGLVLGSPDSGPASAGSATLTLDLGHR